MKKLIVLASMLLISGIAYAEPVVEYDTTSGTVTNCRNIGDPRIWLNDFNDINTPKAGYLYVPNGCSSLPSVAWKYLKVENGAVVELTQVEKNAVDSAEAGTEKAERDARIDAEQYGEVALNRTVTEMMIKRQGFTKEEIKTEMKKLADRGKVFV